MVCINIVRLRQGLTILIISQRLAMGSAALAMCNQMGSLVAMSTGLPRIATRLAYLMSVVRSELPSSRSLSVSMLTWVARISSAWKSRFP